MNRQTVRMVTLKEALDALGNDALEIAEKLRSLGIRGYPGSHCLCPIARYLERSGFSLPDVRLGDVSACDEHGAYVVTTPYAIRKFLSAFDRGNYPFLEPK